MTEENKRKYGKAVLKAAPIYVQGEVFIMTEDELRDIKAEIELALLKIARG